jgi:hypothetical protein
VTNKYTIAGVTGTMTCGATRRDGLFASQTWTAQRWRGDRSVKVKLRFDDECRNGHMTFAITGTEYEKWKDGACGSIHDTIREWFPELAPLIKWHLTSTDGPMHYIANTVYHASDRDHWGLRKGEKKPVRRGGKGPITWRLVIDDTLPKEIECEAEPKTGVAAFHYEPWCRIGEGKKRELEHARSSAVWPEATDEQLCAGPAALAAMLRARLPQLLAEFKSAMVDMCGFEWREVTK